MYLVWKIFLTLSTDSQQDKKQPAVPAKKPAAVKVSSSRCRKLSLSTDTVLLAVSQAMGADHLVLARGRGGESEWFLIVFSNVG